jgi:hypothetical protein
MMHALQRFNEFRRRRFDLKKGKKNDVRAVKQQHRGCALESSLPVKRGLRQGRLPAIVPSARR